MQVIPDKLPALSRQPDPVETLAVVGELRKASELGLLVATEPLAQLTLGWHPPSKASVSTAFPPWSIPAKRTIISMSFEDRTLYCRSAELLITQMLWACCLIKLGPDCLLLSALFGTQKSKPNLQIP